MSLLDLTTWKNSPDGKILKSDTFVAKNYLDEEEINELNRVVNMYLDYAENQARKQIPMKMIDWIDRLNSFLEFNEYKVLDGSGSISSKVAKELAYNEYDKYRIGQDKEYKSDFDKEIEKYLK